MPKMCTHTVCADILFYERNGNNNFYPFCIQESFKFTFATVPAILDWFKRVGKSPKDALHHFQPLALASPLPVTDS